MSLKLIVAMLLVKTIYNLREVDAIKADNMKINIVSLADCDLPAAAYDKDNYVKHYMSAYKVDRKTTRIRANFTIDHKIGPVFANLRNYEMTRGSRQNKVSDMDNMHCSHFLISSIVNMMKIKATDDCVVLPGNYSFDDFEMEQLSNFMFLVWRLGRYAYELEFKTSGGVITCIRIVCDFISEHPTKSTKKISTE